MDEKRPPEKDEAPAQSARTHSGRPTATFLPIDMFAVCCDTNRCLFLFLRIPSTVSQYLYNSRKKRHSITVSTRRQKSAQHCFESWRNNAKENVSSFNPLLICIICNDSELSAILLGIRQQKSHNTNKPVLPNKSIPVVPYSQRTSRFDVCSAVHCDLAWQRATKNGKLPMQRTEQSTGAQPDFNFWRSKKDLQV